MKKKLMTVLALVLVIALSVAGTYAYLTSQASVKNTFTVGKVAITMDEAKVNVDGQKLNDKGTVAAEGDTLADRVHENSYKLMPGHTYVKDPTVVVTGGSENCWLFVKVENGVAAYEKAGDTTIAKQIEDNGWTALDAVNHPGVYYKSVTKNDAAQPFDVFGNFTIADSADAVAGWSNVTAENTKIVVTAYAIQADGFTTAAAAWAEVSK